MKLREKKRRVFILISLSLMGIAMLAQNCDTSSGTTGSSSSSSSGHSSSGGGTTQEFSTVSIVQSEKASASDLNQTDIKAMVRQACDLAGGLASVVSSGDTVVLKVNLVTKNDYCKPGYQGYPLTAETNGTTTDWRVTKAVVDLVREINPGGKVYIMEGSAQNTSEVMSALNYTSAYFPNVDGFIKLENDDDLVTVTPPGAMVHGSYKLNRIYKEADVLISIPCLKNHWDAVVSGAIKNVGIGAVPASGYGGNTVRMGYINHDTIELHRWIRDFYLCRPVDFVVMDGLQGIQNGPTPSYEVSGATNLKEDQMNMRLILAGKDAVAVDTIETLIMNWAPNSVEYLKLLAQSGAGNLDTAKIRVVGKQVYQVRKDFAGETFKQQPIGSKLTDATAPIVSISGCVRQDNTLTLMLDANSDTYSVQIYLGTNILGAPLSSGFSMFTCDVNGISNDCTNGYILAFDQALNCSSNTFTVANKGIYSAKQAGTPPVIDGNGSDSCWSSVSWHPIDETWLENKPDANDFSGRYKIVWDPDYLYILAEITDDVLNDPHLNPTDQYWNDDTLEIFLDRNKSGGDHTYNYNAFAYHLAINGVDAIDLHTDHNPTNLKAHVTVAIATNGTKYTWEVKMQAYNDDFDGLNGTLAPLAAGQSLGFAIAYCDNDGGNDRQNFIGSVYISGTDKNVCWQNADHFGELKLKN